MKRLFYSLCSMGLLYSDITYEYGVLSEFVGDLPDEHDQRYLGIQRIGPGQWNIEGKTDIDDF